jgi:hypothetical protein
VLSSQTAAGGAGGTNVDVMSDFKGPLIDKEGKLYIDEEYDQTYKKRLRNKEVLQIQAYVQSEE